MPDYGCNLCRAGWNVSAIRWRHALPGLSTGEFDAEVLSTGHRDRGAPRSWRRRDFGQHRSGATETARFGRDVMDRGGNVVAWFCVPGRIRVVRAVGLGVPAGSSRRSPRSGRQGSGIRACPVTATGKSVVAGGPVVARDRYSRLAGLSPVAVARRWSPVASPRRGLAEAPQHARQAMLVRPTGHAGRSVVAR